MTTLKDCILDPSRQDQFRARRKRLARCGVAEVRGLLHQSGGVDIGCVYISCVRRWLAGDLLDAGDAHSPTETAYMYCRLC